jgi:hypothetical protein
MNTLPELFLYNVLSEVDDFVNELIKKNEWVYKREKDERAETAKYSV